MEPPFTLEQFVSVFEAYNRNVWPMPVIMYILAGLGIAMLFAKEQLRDRALPFILAFYWLWMGVVYHIGHFAAINRAAIAFGAVFILQGILFALAGARRWLGFGTGKNPRTILGFTAILYALVIYPLIGALAGHGYPHGPMLGVPCPTTILSLGFLMIVRRTYPGFLLIIPFLWALVASNVIRMGIVEDTGLFIAAVATVLIHWRTKREAA